MGLNLTSDTRVEPWPCWHCDTRTRYTEVNFEAALHPVPCAEVKWAEYLNLMGLGWDEYERFV